MGEQLRKGTAGEGSCTPQEGRRGRDNKKRKMNLNVQQLVRRVTPVQAAGGGGGTKGIVPAGYLKLVFIFLSFCCYFHVHEYQNY
jgi:hypothetical protein